ncbi:hypothetical protein [Mycobacterium sp. DL440]|uniref:hypothetical protein n=1 Tax=Mycobacterium sp. DL440 TaxID=2675523 RepID=UPI00141EE36C|nr:hypothetical protein [Mycobacterium sp. DL440]
MGEAIKVDDAGLHQLADAQDTAATVLTGTTAPPATRSSVSASTIAVEQGHGLITAAASILATRTRATGAKVRTAADSYVSTDGNSALRIADIGQTVQV